MKTDQDTFTCADDNYVVAAIDKAQRRLVVVAPSLRLPVAEALARKWRNLGPQKVTVTLDADPEAFRDGIGDLSALELLDTTARGLATLLHRRPGLWIGIIVSDDSTLFFSPTPQGSLTPGSPVRQNGFTLSQAVLNPLQQTAEDLAKSPVPDQERIDSKSIAKLREDLAKNPPQPVAAAEMIRVFNAFFEFVELELLGTALQRRTIPIPTELLGLAQSDHNLRERMHASFRLVGDEDRSKLSGRKLDELKRKTMDNHLIPLKDYGKVVLRSVKPEFEEAVEKLRAEVSAFKKTVEKQLDKAIDRNLKELVKVLLPAVKKHPPADWKRFGAQMEDDDYRRILEGGLRKAFGTAKDILGEMKVNCVFKGVTYELLTNHHFLSMAANAIPNFSKLHREFDAIIVKQRKEVQPALHLD
jgi:hypothetical protein